MTSPLLHRLGALLCGAVYFPLGLVWAYGAALVVVPVAGLGCWLLRRADWLERSRGDVITPAQARLRLIVWWMLGTGVVASVVALVATR